MKTNNVITRFREKFNWHEDKSYVFVNSHGKEKVESFLLEELENQRKEFEEIVKVLQQKSPLPRYNSSPLIDGYHHALNDILDALKKKGEQ